MCDIFLQKNDYFYSLANNGKVIIFRQYFALVYYYRELTKRLFSMEFFGARSINFSNAVMERSIALTAASAAQCNSTGA